MTSFSLEVSHLQIAVFDPELARPFNDWTKRHTLQGFAWRPGSVSFTTLDGAGETDVIVETVPSASTDATIGERIICVPFLVPDHGRVEFATISQSEVLELTPGHYELTFVHGRSVGRSDDDGMWAKFLFRPVYAPVGARVIRGDPQYVPGTELIMTTEPA